MAGKDSKSPALKSVPVRVRPLVPQKIQSIQRLAKNKATHFYGETIHLTDQVTHR